jgi:hypothetical protein
VVNVLILQLYLVLYGPYWAHWAIILASKGPTRSTGHTPAKTKQLTSKIPQKLVIIRTLCKAEGPTAIVYGIKWQCVRTFSHRHWKNLN